MADFNMHRLFQGTVSWVFLPLRFKFVETFEFKIRLPIEYAAGVLIDVCQETLDSEVFPYVIICLIVPLRKLEAFQSFLTWLLADNFDFLLHYVEQWIDFSSE